MRIADLIPADKCGAFEIRDSPFRRLVQIDGGETMWMEDTAREIETQRVAINEAKRRGGKVLTTGLGLGMFADMCLDSPAVESVTIIEKNLEVVNLVWPTLKGKHGHRVILILADALEWMPTSRYTVVWHDFWESAFSHFSAKCREVLTPRFEPWCDWQGFWECA